MKIEHKDINYQELRTNGLADNGWCSGIAMNTYSVNLRKGILKGKNTVLKYIE